VIFFGSGVVQLSLFENNRQSVQGAMADFVAALWGSSQFLPTLRAELVGHGLAPSLGSVARFWDASRFFGTRGRTGLPLSCHADCEFSSGWENGVRRWNWEMGGGGWVAFLYFFKHSPG